LWRGSVLPAAQCAHRAEFGGAVRDGDGDAAAGAVALAAWQGQAQPALARLEMLDPDRRQLGAPQGSGEADQQQGAVAQSDQVVADRGEDLPQNVDGGGQFLGRQVAPVGGGAVDAGHGLGHVRLSGGHRATGDEVQIADGGAAQVDGGDAGAAAALGGEEGDHVGGAGRQAGQGVLIAPGAPGTHAGAVGQPCVGGLGAVRVSAGGSAGGADGAVMVRDRGGGGIVEPGAH
jgi:hypothetical protein